MIRRVIGVCFLNVGGFLAGIYLSHYSSLSLVQASPDLYTVVGMAALIVGVLLAFSKRAGLWVVGAIVAFLGGILAGLMGPLCELVSLLVIAVTFLVSGILLVVWPEERGQTKRS